MNTPPQTLRIALAQQNYTVGALAENARLLVEAYHYALEQQADLIIYPELCITGYPPEDLILDKAFVRTAMQHAQQLAGLTKDRSTAMLIGCPWEDGGKVYNAALLLEGGEIKHVQYKYDLPNYGVFDEKRVFAAGPLPTPMLFRGIRLGVMICEDMWNVKLPEALAEADLLISINASPYEIEKHDTRLERASHAIRFLHRPLIYVNQLCGHDDLVFDGDSFVLSADEEIMVRLSRTKDELTVTEWQFDGRIWRCKPGAMVAYPTREEVMYQAVMLGLREYVHKNGFKGVVLGMSGGIDSGLCAAIAVDALGAKNVRLVFMPSEFTSRESKEDAAACALQLGVRLEEMSIEPTVAAVEATLARVFENRPRDLAEENIQARARGLLLMAISNKDGPMLLATGNKSEYSVGYSTLYGDMCGGYAPLKDLYKTQVYLLSRWRNRQKPEGGLGPSGTLIPPRMIEKAPTAELRPHQTDQDTLPPYDQLDSILKEFIEEQKTVDAIAHGGYPRDLVERIVDMVQKAEYKRRQSPPGPKINKRPYSRDRRMPITHRWRYTTLQG